MTDSLDDFLRNPPTEPKCMSCKNVQLAADLVTYLDKLAAGTTSVPLQTVWEHHLRIKYPHAPWAISSVRRHIKNCLRRSPTTGATL